MTGVQTCALPISMHGGRFTGDPAYFKHVRKATCKLMERFNLKANDLNYFVAHQPNPTFPVRIAKELGFRDEQYLPSLQINKFGNTYSGCSLVGLAAVLDIAEPEERILVASYGSGAGSDAYLLRTTRSEERRVGKECRIGCRSRWSPYH